MADGGGKIGCCQADPGAGGGAVLQMSGLWSIVLEIFHFLSI